MIGLLLIIVEQRRNLEQIESLSLYGAEDLGRIKEAIYIYEDLIDIWEN